MEDFLKIYGIFIGFIFGILSMYVKYFVDKRIGRGRSKEKLHKLYSFVKDSYPPEWSKTYKETEIEIIYAAFEKNKNNIRKFKSRVQVVFAFCNEISNDIHSHLSLVDIVKFHAIRLWSENTLDEINKDNKKSQELDFSATEKKLNSYHDVENLSDEELERAMKLREIFEENKSNFESYIRGTESLFLVVRSDYESILETCELRSISKLEYSY